MFINRFLYNNNNPNAVIIGLAPTIVQYTPAAECAGHIYYNI